VDVTLTGVISTFITSINWACDVCTARLESTGAVWASLLAVLTLRRDTLVGAFSARTVITEHRSVQWAVVLSWAVSFKLSA
jgi:hypothetical protein